MIHCNASARAASAANTRRNRPTIGGGIGGLHIDGTSLLKTAPETNNASAHEFTYAPSGLRVRDKRTGTNAIDKRFVYTTSGALMSVHESPSKRRDIVYANGEAIAEIDQDGNVYELHNDHLGTPRYVTNGNVSQSNKGQIIGQQAFGPYGEEMRGTFSGGQTLPSGYVPVTGYTGHLNEDLSGLIYMKGRYYSPLWHRFINSDQGVDPKSINQYAYVGGSPFMAKDPMGMAAVMYCTTYYYSTGGTGVEYDPETGLWTETAKINDNSYQDCYTLDWDDWRGGWPGDYGEGGGESGGGGIGPGQNLTAKDIDRAACEAYKALVEKYGGIPTGQTEAGAKLYYDNGKVNFSAFVSHTAPNGKAPSLPNLMAVRVTGTPLGYIHTHPSFTTKGLDGKPYANYLIPWANVSSGDIFNLGESFKNGFGYVTAPELWKTNQIIRFQTEDSIRAKYNMIDCSKL